MLDGYITDTHLCGLWTWQKVHSVFSHLLFSSKVYKAHFYLHQLGSTRHDLDVVTAMCPNILQRNKYATWMLQQRWTSRQEYTCCSVCGFSSDSGITALFCSHFSCCRFSKIEVQTLSWLIRWHHWWANQWHAVGRHHILAPAWIAWNPSWADTILVPVTRYCDLKTTVNHDESIRVGANWKGA